MGSRVLAHVAGRTSKPLMQRRICGVALVLQYQVWRGGQVVAFLVDQKVSRKQVRNLDVRRGVTIEARSAVKGFSGEVSNPKSRTKLCE